MVRSYYVGGSEIRPDGHRPSGEVPRTSGMGSRTEPRCGDTLREPSVDGRPWSREVSLPKGRVSVSDEGRGVREPIPRT